MRHLGLVSKERGEQILMIITRKHILAGILAMSMACLAFYAQEPTQGAAKPGDGKPLHTPMASVPPLESELLPEATVQAPESAPMPMEAPEDLSSESPTAVPPPPTCPSFIPPSPDHGLAVPAPVVAAPAPASQYLEVRSTEPLAPAPVEPKLRPMGTEPPMPPTPTTEPPLSTTKVMVDPVPVHEVPPPSLPSFDPPMSEPPAFPNVPPSSPITPASATSLPPTPALTPPTTSVEFEPFRFGMWMGDGKRPRFEVKTGTELIMKVYGDRMTIEGNQPASRYGLPKVTASGKVRFTGPAIEGTCDQLAIVHASGRVVLEGNIHLRCKKGRVFSELLAERIAFQLSGQGEISTLETTTRRHSE